MEIVIDRAIQNAIPVLNKIEEYGYEAYFVGGAIRDALLQEPIHDVDIATSALPQMIQKIFPKHFDVGIEHGTVMVWYEGATYEVTTFRTESDYDDYRRPRDVAFVRSLKEDLMRRDFTVNALAMNQYGKVIDYFDGQSDLAEKIIRAVGNPNERFHEDALRMMRAVRFASQLDFTIESETKRALQDNASLLQHIAVERIHQEMSRLWMGECWQKGITTWIETELYRYCPKMIAFAGACREMIEKLSPKSHFYQATFAWAVLFLLQNSDENKENMLSFAKAWKMSNEEAKQIICYYNLLQLRRVGAFDALTLYRYGLENCLQVEAFISDEQSSQSSFGQSFSLAYPSRIRQKWEALTIHQRNELALNGYDIIQQLNPEDKKYIGKWIEEAEKAVVLGECFNQREDLIRYITRNQE